MSGGLARYGSDSCGGQTVSHGPVRFPGLPRYVAYLLPLGAPA